MGSDALQCVDCFATSINDRIVTVSGKKSRINRRAFVNLVDLLFGLNMSVRSAVIRLMTLSQGFYLGRGGRKKAQKTYCSFVIVRADSRRRSRDTAF